MFFKQFFLEGLGHASYLVGSEQSGEALALDPQRNVEQYFEQARAQGLRIVRAIDTHGHNDYLSGLTEIVARGAVGVLGSAEGRLGYAHQPVRDGEVIELGDVAIEGLHTPGHTPEHVSLLVYGRSAGPDPALLLSGGALLVGDLARPDLLGGGEETSRSAKSFCHTIQEKILRLPDHVEVYPTHVSGSLCGGNIGSRLSTTVGYERRTNAILAKVSSSDQCCRRSASTNCMSVSLGVSSRFSMFGNPPNGRRATLKVPDSSREQSCPSGSQRYLGISPSPRSAAAAIARRWRRACWPRRDTGR